MSVPLKMIADAAPRPSIIAFSTLPQGEQTQSMCSSFETATVVMHIGERVSNLPASRMVTFSGLQFPIFILLLSDIYSYYPSRPSLHLKSHNGPKQLFNKSLKSYHFQLVNTTPNLFVVQFQISHSDYYVLLFVYVFLLLLIAIISTLIVQSMYNLYYFSDLMKKNRRSSLKPIKQTIFSHYKRLRLVQMLSISILVNGLRYDAEIFARISKLQRFQCDVFRNAIPERDRTIVKNYILSNMKALGKQRQDVISFIMLDIGKAVSHLLPTIDRQQYLPSVKQITIQCQGQLARSGKRKMAFWTVTEIKYILMGMLMNASNLQGIKSICKYTTTISRSYKDIKSKVEKLIKEIQVDLVEEIKSIIRFESHHRGFKAIQQKLIRLIQGNQEIDSAAKKTNIMVIKQLMLDVIEQKKGQPEMEQEEVVEYLN